MREQAAQPEEEMAPLEDYPEEPKDDAVNRVPNIPLVDFTNTRIFTPKEMEAKGKRWAHQVRLSRAGKKQTDNLPTDPAEAKALARKLYTPLNFAEWEPAFDKALA